MTGRKTYIQNGFDLMMGRYDLVSKLVDLGIEGRHLVAEESLDETLTRECEKFPQYFTYVLYSLSP